MCTCSRGPYVVPTHLELPTILWDKTGCDISRSSGDGGVLFPQVQVLGRVIQALGAGLHMQGHKGVKWPGESGWRVRGEVLPRGRKLSCANGSSGKGWKSSLGLTGYQSLL